MHNSSSPNHISAFQKSDRYCALALICLSAAILILAVGTFIDNPTSIIGILSVCAGILLMICCIIFFAFYRHYLKQEEHSQR